MKTLIEDIVALGTFLGLAYMILLWGSIGEALAGL